MKEQTLLIGAVIATLVLVPLSRTLGSAQGWPDSSPDSGREGKVPDPGAGVSGDDSNPIGPPVVSIPERYRAGGSGDAISVASATATASVPTATIYFTPQDENTSTTVLFLYSTSTVTATVGLRTYRLDGATYISTSLTVPPRGLVRICGDGVSTISTTWVETVLVNFTTSSTYAEMTLPSGIKAEGYVAWNGSAPYDPLEAVPTLPLRFSSDPATVFLPSVRNQ